MKRRAAPDHALDRLDALSRRVEDLTERVARTKEGVAVARDRMSGSFASDAEYNDVEQTLKQLIADGPVLEKKLRAARSTLSACEAWLDGLPEGTILEPVELPPGDADLAEVNARLAAAQAELATLRAAPAPSADIRQRVERYVADMARPTITGVGDGERLRIIWPGAGWDDRGPREYRADPLALTAMLHPEEMAAALMAEIERMANEPMPRREREQRVAALEVEVEDLQRRAIGLGADVVDAPPAVILGVRVARRRAA